MHKLLPILGLTLFAALSAPAQTPKLKAAQATSLSQRERAAQLLNRFTFGPRPGEIDRVLVEGPDKWFERQLNPAAIPDNALEQRLKDYPTLAMTPEQVLETFPDRNFVQQIAEGKYPAPTDPLLASLYEVELYRFRAEQENKLHPAPEPSESDKAAQKKQDQATAARIAGQLFALPKGERMAALNALPPAARIAFASSLEPAQRNPLQADFTPREREMVLAMQSGVNSSYRSVDDLAQAKLLRSVLSERQLQEVMADFWFNHFNIFMPKDSDLWYTTAYERDTIRPHALGHFRDLLLATAQSPAMLVYLDNWLSIGPNSISNGVDPVRPASKPGRKGLNENYGREVMELHTVGVNGGYTQADVTHLSAILTGWGVDRPKEGGGFQFDSKKHEPGAKQWFGYTLDEQGRVLAGPPPSTQTTQFVADTSAPDGMKQGIAALALLAESPRTAHFISYLLAQRFLADDPPPALVDRLATTYLNTGGDIKAILRTLVQSPEFNSHHYFRTKVKMPLEFVASAFRTTATDPQNPGALVNLLANQFGQPLYKALPPTGYYITADHWMNTQSLMGRLNFADQLTHNHFSNQKFDSARVLALSLMTAPAELPQPQSHKVALQPAAQSAGDGSAIALRVLESSLIGGELSSTTDRFIRSQMAQGSSGSSIADSLNQITALLLGSPEFQLH